MALSTNPRDQRLFAIGAIFIVVALAYGWFVYKPKNAELSALETRVDTLAAQNQRARVELSKGNAEELRAQAAQYRQNLTLMRQLVPTGNEVPALLEQVSTAARRVGLDLSEVQPEPVIPGDEFDTYRYKITIVGGYHELGQFLTNVGSLTRIIAPVNLKLTPATGEQAKRHARKGGSALQSDFEMQTYVAKASVAQSPRGPQKGGPKT